MIWRRRQPWRRAAEVAAPSLFSTGADLNRDAQCYIINIYSKATFTLLDGQVLLVWVWDGTGWHWRRRNDEG